MRSVEANIKSYLLSLIWIHKMCLSPSHAQNLITVFHFILGFLVIETRLHFNKMLQLTLQKTFICKSTRLKTRDYHISTLNKYILTKHLTCT